jgi:hypothetical protein
VLCPLFIPGDVLNRSPIPDPPYNATAFPVF